MSDRTMTRGDTLPPLVAVLGDELGPVALTGATVTLRIVAVSGTSVVLDARPCVVDPDQVVRAGHVSYTWQAGETLVPAGIYACQWTVTGPGGVGIWHFPNGGRFTLEVVAAS